MTLEEFQRLCTGASEILGLDDDGALANGLEVAFDDVLFEALFTAGDASFPLLADLGLIAPDDLADAYENLLALQLTAWDDPRVRFGLHPVRESIVLCIGFSGSGADSAALASLIKTAAQQINEWRTTALAGRVMARRGLGLPAGFQGAARAFNTQG